MSVVTTKLNVGGGVGVRVGVIATVELAVGDRDAVGVWVGGI